MPLRKKPSPWYVPLATDTAPRRSPGATLSLDNLRSRKVPRGPRWSSQIWDPRGGPGGAKEARAPLFIAPGCLESHQRRSGTLACSSSWEI